MDDSSSLSWPKQVASMLRHARIKAKLTQDQIAIMVGIDVRSVRRIESGKRPRWPWVVDKWLSSCGRVAYVKSVSMHKSSETRCKASSSTTKRRQSQQ
jgi:hypothetical protein